MSTWQRNSYTLPEEGSEQGFRSLNDVNEAHGASYTCIIIIYTYEE